MIGVRVRLWLLVVVKVMVMVRETIIVNIPKIITLTHSPTPSKHTV